MKLLVAHDGSPQADKALGVAVDMAARLGGEVALVTVIPDLCLSLDELSPESCEAVDKSLAEEATSLIAKAAQRAASGGVKISTHVRKGQPAEVIAEVAEETGADLVVVGSTGKHGARRFLLGSVSSRVAEHAAGNVLIVK